MYVEGRSSEVVLLWYALQASLLLAGQFGCGIIDVFLCNGSCSFLIPNCKYLEFREFGLTDEFHRSVCADFLNLLQGIVMLYCFP